MAAAATTLVCGLVQHVAFSATSTSRFAVYRFPCHTLRRPLAVITSLFSTVSLPNIEQAASDRGGFNVGTPILGDIAATDDVQRGNANVDIGSPFVVSSLFESLKDRVDHNTLKALIVHPFQLETMTPVQRRVITLLPDLVLPWGSEGIVPLNVPKPLEPGWRPPTADGDVPRDVLVRAKAGTGKTFAYIIPAIESRLHHIEHNSNLAVIKAGLESSPCVAGRARLAYRRNSAGPLILAPTKELAAQIASDAQKLTTHQGNFQVQLLVGGAGKALQMKDWNESTRDLVVATPGRLRDLLTNEPGFRQGFKNCPLLILDETDTLLSMGFRDDIDAIVSYLPRSPIRQTFLFSTTIPRSIRQLASWILSPTHTFIDADLRELCLTPRRSGEHVAHSDDELTAHDHIKQFYTLCPTASDQLPTLVKVLAHDQFIHGPSSKVIVFCPTVQMAELFSVLLRSLAPKVLPEHTTEIMTMHSKMKRSERVRTQAWFRKAQNGKSTVLVGSDFSARGTDYPGVTRVIQIGIPDKEAIYIRRMERVARGVNSFAPGIREENRKPITRADMLLLPWEEGYMNWQLTSLPIKSLSIPALDSQLASISSRSSTLTTEHLRSALVEIQHRVDPADVLRTAASLLGYYLPLSPPLRLHPNVVLAGVSSWASECFNVSIPTITRFPKKFTEAYEQMSSEKTKGLFVDGLKVAGPSALGKFKSKNRLVWEGADRRRKRPKRWH